MNNHKSPARQRTRYIFYILMLAILGWFLFMQLFGPDERASDSSHSSILFPDTFTWEKPDGTTEEISIPGQYDVPAGEPMVITTIFPDNYKNSSIAIRSSLQDVSIYIDDTLRTHYSTSQTRLIGKNSASRYIFCPTSHEDAGKELRIELTTYTPQYAGVVNPVYSGSKTDIWQFIFSKYAPATYIAFFILFTGLTAILFSFTLEFVYHTSFDMEYLGWCMVMAATWMIGESKLRQLLVPNATALSSMCFVMILLGPIPLLLYANSVLHRLHSRLYRSVSRVALLNFAICTILAIAGIADYIETLPIGQILLVGTFLMVFIDICRYSHKSKIHTDHILLLGLLIAMLGIIAESISVYLITSLSGLFVGASMIIALLVNLIRTARNIQLLETKRQQEKQKENERISLQMMQTLSTTIEAKDEYTRGHSSRVAEYAAQIATELGWQEKEVQQLKHAAYLHDIGKIGIPDQILNKPSKLTEDEYNLIKQHPVIGAEILKDITFIPHIVEVARSHHERYDGNGYPDGLGGTDIPIHARIVSMADSYDAMNSRRIYRNALPQEMIRDEIIKNRGKQFDPKIADIFLRLMNENRLTLSSSEDSQADQTTPLPELNHTINKFISEVVTTIKSQEDTKNYDFLTGLPMRNLGERLIAEFMQEHDGCLIFLDMDNLKKINDLYGHKAGDRALKNLGNLLSRHTENGISCRLGGDEFLLFIPDITPQAVSEQITQLFQQFHSIAEEDAEIRYASLSAGLYMCTCTDSFADCYAKADKALYYVKRNGKNQFSFYQQVNYQEHNTPGASKDLNLIANTLRESGNYTGALDLSYRDFSRQYEYIHQIIFRNNCHCYLVMVTMETVADTLPHIEEIELALSQMEQAIRSTIRRVDICTRYSAMQHLIILFEPMELQIPRIMERIFIQYYKYSESHDFRPTYEYLDMSDSKTDSEIKN